MNFNYEAFALSDDDRKKMEAGLMLHKRHSSLQFRVLEYDSNSIIIRAQQSKSFNGNYFTGKKLYDIAKEFFTPFAGGRVVHIRPVIHRSSPVDIVTPLWIQQQMIKHDVKSRDLVADLGVGKSEISKYINGKAPMAQTTKAMFFYYFEAL